ncbi:putative quinol monooxygenase [Pseudomonas lopnurensis]|uniref:putative quinol monooxygenase n=1 Tax=Pseudomonas lopnurensis TaxID=1477517 RepID=UPI0028ABF0A1|nr:antibiotic biosynthesis monooxygenase [Pseudomonas lopnurensis]
MKDEVINIFTLSLAPENFPEFKRLVAEIVAATSQEPGTLMYEYSVNDEHTVVHIIERYRADAVVSHIEQTFAPFGEKFLELVTITSLLVYGSPDEPTRKHLDAFGAVYMNSFDGFTRT